MEEDSNGCLFVGQFGLFKVYCVFKVMCIHSVNTIDQGDIVFVTAVKTSPNANIVYEINGAYYYHHNFILYIDSNSKP